MRNKLLGIAIDQYDDPLIKNLNNCRSDLLKLIDVFNSKYEFDDIELILEKEQTTKSYVYQRLYDEMINSIEGDNLILLFLGHGEFNEYNEKSYWLTSDCKFEDQSTWLPVNEIFSFLKKSEIFHFCLISDCCYSGAIFEELERGGGLKSLEQRRSRFALTSGSKESVKDGEIGGSSPFNKVLCEVLDNNQLPEISFESISNQVISIFPEGLKQTPLFGHLNGLGDMGGAFILRLKNDISDFVKIKEVNLALNIKEDINIDFNCKVPLFERSDLFDVNMFNANIQNSAYKLISDLRTFLIGDSIYFIEENRHLDYHIFGTVNLVSSKYVSVTISTNFYLGGPYPANEVIAINFILDPERKIYINDLIDIKEEGKFFRDLVDKYSDCEEQQEVLLHYVDSFRVKDIVFSISSENIDIYLINYIPKVVQCHAFLQIPLIDFNIDIGQVYEVNYE